MLRWRWHPHGRLLLCKSSLSLQERQNPAVLTKKQCGKAAAEWRGSQYWERWHQPWWSCCLTQSARWAENTESSFGRIISCCHDAQNQVSEKPCLMAWSHSIVPDPLSLHILTSATLRKKMIQGRAKVSLSSRGILGHIHTLWACWRI